MDTVSVLAEIKEKLAGKVEVMAVTKTVSPEDIAPVLDAGQRAFGENRVAEAEKKWPKLKEKYKGVVLHLIGHLQTNKIKEALEVFDCIDTLDSPKLAEKIAALPKELWQDKVFMAEVNTGSEPQKSGFLPEEIEGFLRASPLPISGLMCVPPVGEEPSPHFAFIRTLANKYHLPTVSAGMSSDYEIAVEQGANLVRLGTVLFGSRNR